MLVVRQDVEFRSGGAALRGWLYPARRSESAAPAPAVVMAHGLSAVKEMFLDDYAEVFAAAGVTTLVYDNPGFGASDGEPRLAPSPAVQVQGYRDAITWLAAHPDVDEARIGVWGTSFSGGHAITVAARDPRVRCAVAQVPGLGVGGPPASAAFVAALADAVERDGMVPATSARADGPAVMRVDGAYEWFHRVSAARAPAWRNELRARSLTKFTGYRPIENLRAVRIPLLILYAVDDALTPPGPAIELAAQMANVEARELAGGHFDAYEGDGFLRSSGLAAQWFASHLCC